MDLRTKIQDSVEISQNVVQLKPTQLYILPKGSIDNKPSFAIVCSNRSGEGLVVAQVSFQMIFDSLTIEGFKLLEREWRSMKGQLPPTYVDHISGEVSL